MILKEHIYKEKKEKNILFGHVPLSFSIKEASLMGIFVNEIESGPLEFKSKTVFSYLYRIFFFNNYAYKIISIYL